MRMRTSTPSSLWRGSSARRPCPTKPAGRAFTRSTVAPYPFCLPVRVASHNHRDLAEALDLIEADSLGRTSEQFVRYRALIHRLVALAEAVDPAQAIDEQFSAKTPSPSSRAEASTAPLGHASRSRL